MSMRTVPRALVMVVAACWATGCYTVEANLPGTLRNDVKAADTEPKGTLTIEKTNWFLFWGLVGAPAPDFFSAEIKRQVQAKGADGVAKLTYESQDGCADLLVGGLTLGIVAPRTYKVTGDLVRIKAAPLPGKPSKTVAAPLAGDKVAQSF